jgi:hypothetical protein
MTLRQNLSAMQRQQKITLGEMRSSGGPTRLIVYGGDNRCAYSVVRLAETISRTLVRRVAAVGAAT